MSTTSISNPSKGHPTNPSHARQQSGHTSAASKQAAKAKTANTNEAGVIIPSQVSHNLVSTNVVATQTVHKVNLSHPHDNSRLLDSDVKTTSVPDSQFCFKPTPLAVPEKAPASDIIDSSTGEFATNIVLELAKQGIQLFENYMTQINTLVKLPLDLAMNLWNVLAAATSANAEKQKKEMQDQVESARAAAASAAKCGIATAFTEIGIGIAIAAISLVAIAGAAETGGASLTLAFAVISLASSMVMIADGGVKANANVKLLQAANQSGFNFANTMNELMGQLQHGIFSLLAGSNAGLAENIFDAVSMVASLGSTTAEMAAAEATTEAAAKAAESAFAKISLRVGQGVSVVNSATMMAGMIGSIADPTGSAVDKGKHGVSLWQAMSFGIAGAFIYTIFETAPAGKKTLSEQITEKSDYGAMIVESMLLIVGMIVAGYVEGKYIRPKFELKGGLMGNDMFHQYNKWFMVKQGANSIGQATQNVFISLQSSSMAHQSAEWMKIHQELSRQQATIQNIVASSNRTSQELLKDATATVGQNINNFFNNLKQFFTSQGQALRSNY